MKFNFSITNFVNNCEIYQEGIYFVQVNLFFENFLFFIFDKCSIIVHVLCTSVLPDCKMSSYKIDIEKIRARIMGDKKKSTIHK